MNGRIARLHTRHRIIPASDGTGGAAVARLDRVLQTRLAGAIDEALTQAFGDDAAVYVLRRLDTRLVLAIQPDLSDDRLAQRWAERIVGDAVRYIAHRADDGRDLIRFENQAEYVAQFIVDLWDGQAWERWFYGAFVPLRADNTANTLRNVLRENSDHLPDILNRLYQRGQLEKLFRLLDEQTLRSLWTRSLGAAADGSQAALRPLFASALRLVEQLGWWRSLRPANETLFTDYLATGPLAADWRGRQGLAVAVFSIVAFLNQRGYLSLPQAATDADFLTRLDTALGDFDWLDRARLRDALMRQLVEPPTQPGDLPARPGGYGPTPRQQRLLDDLWEAITAQQRELDREHPNGAANALRLYTWLIAKAPRWTDDALATDVIQGLLDVWSWLVHSRSPLQALQGLRQRDVAGALGTLPEALRSQAARPFRVLVALGPPGFSVVEALTSIAPLTALARHPVGDAQSSDRATWLMARPGVDTRCAGVFLLLRAVLDMRLPALVAQGNYPALGPLAPREAFLIALGLRWAGAGSVIDGQVDAGLGLLAGRDEPLELATLRENWLDLEATAHDRFQFGLLQLLSGHRLLKAGRMHLYRVTLGSGHALVVSDETTRLWPLGCATKEADVNSQVIVNWMELWRTATGKEPILVVARPLADMISDVTNHVIVPEKAELATAHQAGYEALAAALDALVGGRLDLLAADLTISLTAMAALRAWSRWLRQFAASSIPYLLKNLIRRPGRVYADGDEILVEMEPRPLDIVIEMAGYTSALEQIPWLGQRRVRFSIRGS